MHVPCLCQDIYRASNPEPLSCEWFRWNRGITRNSVVPFCTYQSRPPGGRSRTKACPCGCICTDCSIRRHWYCSTPRHPFYNHDHRAAHKRCHSSPRPMHRQPVGSKVAHKKQQEPTKRIISRKSPKSLRNGRASKSLRSLQSPNQTTQP